jgi:hypothetical protein
VTEAVYSERDLETVRTQAAGSSDPRVVDHRVELNTAQLDGCAFDGSERCEIELQVLGLSPESFEYGCCARATSTREDDVCAARCESQRGRGSNPGVGACDEMRRLMLVHLAVNARRIALQRENAMGGKEEATSGGSVGFVALREILGLFRLALRVTRTLGSALGKPGVGTFFDAAIAPRGIGSDEQHVDESYTQNGDRYREVDVRHGAKFEADVRMTCAAVFACALASTPSLAHALRPERYVVRATVDVASGRVEEDVTITMQVAEGEREVRLWLYADRLAVTPSVVGERTWRWVYPGEADHGGFVDARVEVEGEAVDARVVSLGETGAQRARDFGGSDWVLPIEAGPARTIDVHIHATLDVPDRFGRLGHASGRVSLEAPWYPLVLDGETWAFDVPHEVHVEARGGAVATADGQLAGVVDVHATTSYVPLMASASLRIRTANAEGHELRLIEPPDGYVPPPRDAEAEFGLEDLTGIDRLGMMREALVDVVRTARWLGVEVPARVVVLVVPSRSELAATVPGAVIVSDRIFQVFPLDDIRETHRRMMRRALFRLVAQGLGVIDAPSDRAWTDDLRAVVLQDLDQFRRQPGGQTVDQLLQPFSFHPAVDQLLYAPQVAFEDAYFGAADEPDAYRDDPVRARLPLARGRRLVESARDELGAERMQRLVAMLVHAERPARDAFERAMPGALRHLPTWLAYPSLETNYRLGDIASEPTEAGTRHTIEVIREGDAREEPITVDVEDERGEHVTGVWDGHGDRGEVVIETRAPRARVSLDPQQRVPQSARVADGHPRLDDATSQPWRLPLLNNFSIDVLASEGNVTGLADITLRQRYDLEHTITLRLARTVARTTGRVRYLQGFGPKVHNNRRAFQVGGSFAFGRVEPNFGGVSLGGWTLEVDATVLVSTLNYLADPREGLTAFVQVAGAGTLRDDGSITGTMRGSFRASWTLPVSLMNAFVLVAGGGFTAGAALDAERQYLGGRYGLRGFANDELIGSGMLFLVAEHRTTLITDMAINILHGVWAREVQMAVWGGIGGVFGTLRNEDAVFAGEAGVGLRFHYEYGGVQPGVLAIDVGFPVSRLIEGRAGNPVGFYLSFDQYY